MNKVLVICTTDSMIWSFLVPHIQLLKEKGITVECACSRTGFFFDELCSRGITLHEISFTRSPFTLSNAKALRNLLKLLKSSHFDFIQCHEPVGGVMGRLAAWRLRIPVMYVAHGFHFFKGAPRKASIYYVIEYCLSFLTTQLVTINKEDFEASKRMHAKSTALVHGIGIDTKKFRYLPDMAGLRETLGLDVTKKYILSVGELIQRKNQAVIIRSLRRLDDDVHYIIVGNGPEENELRILSRQLDVDERVHFFGFRKDVGKICNSVDVFVMPSYQEGLSVALMEAMACARPIVASRIRGNVDLIDEGKGGYLVDVEDDKEYAEAIARILYDKYAATRFGQYNVEKVKRFDIENVKMEFVDLMGL